MSAGRYGGTTPYAPFGVPLADDDPGVPVRLPLSMVAAMRLELESRGAYAVPRTAAILYLIDHTPPTETTTSDRRAT